MNIMTTKFQMANGIKEIILFELNRTTHTIKDACASVEAYQNGREQGYTINVYGAKAYSKCVTISEHRNSDGIVVYKENHNNQGLDDEAYKNANYFERGNYSGVITLCVNYLLDLKS